jgi:Nif-specific regulatory protein
LGEGITGRVVETGKPIVVPKVSREPMFLNRAGKRDLNKQEITYLCVPIVVKGRTVGALGVDLKFRADRDYESESKCLSLIAAMMAQAIKAEHLVDDERRRLMDENKSHRSRTRPQRCSSAESPVPEKSSSHTPYTTIRRALRNHSSK